MEEFPGIGGICIGVIGGIFIEIIGGICIGLIGGMFSGIIGEWVFRIYVDVSNDNSNIVVLLMNLWSGTKS